MFGMVWWKWWHNLIMRSLVRFLVWTFFTLFSLFKPNFNLMELTIYSVYYTINGSVEMMIQLNSGLSGSIPDHKLFLKPNSNIDSMPQGFTLFSLFKPNSNLMELTIYYVYYTINGSVEMMIQLNSMVSGSIPGHKLFFCLNQILTSIPCCKFFTLFSLFITPPILI
jgi:hypothetical protein